MNSTPTCFVEPHFKVGPTGENPSPMEWMPVRNPVGVRLGSSSAKRINHDRAWTMRLHFVVSHSTAHPVPMSSQGKKVTEKNFSLNVISPQSTDSTIFVFL